MDDVLDIPQSPQLDEGTRKIVLAHREVYSTPKGMAVLAMELNDLRFFAEDLGDKPDDLVKMRLARKKLKNLGIWRPENMGRLVQQMFNLPFDNPKENNSGSDE